MRGRRLRLLGYNSKIHRTGWLLTPSMPAAGPPASAPTAALVVDACEVLVQRRVAVISLTLRSARDGQAVGGV